MRSTSGSHFIALDHVRALAAFLVFAWHFLHGFGGSPEPFAGTSPIPFLALFDEGHTGVALFMALSGYLFAKLLDGRSIVFGRFLMNRALRLLPLLLVVLLLVGLRRWAAGADMEAYMLQLLKGPIAPTLPNGGWSITVEAHFYLLLPLLLFTQRRTPWGLPLAILAAVGFRAWFHHEFGEVQRLSYFTLGGRFDQFVLGILAFRYRESIARPALLAPVLGAFALFYWWFARNGGLYLPQYPSPSALWIFMPTIEGLAYSLLIACYDKWCTAADAGVSRLVARLGAYSYAIYLTHFFFVFEVSQWIHENLIDLSSIYVALPIALVCFVAMLPIGWFCFRFIESPFLKRRVPYARGQESSTQENLRLSSTSPGLGSANRSTS